MPAPFDFGFTIPTLKAWRYKCEIPSRLQSDYGYPRGHKLYRECTEWRQVRDVPKGWKFL